MPGLSNVTENGLHNVTESEFDLITEESISNDTTVNPDSVTAEGISRYISQGVAVLFLPSLLSRLFRLAYLKTDKFS